MRKKILVIIFASLYCFTAYSQEDFNLKEFVSEKNKLQGKVEHGYVITKDNERKPGFVIMSDDARNSKYIYFQKYKGAKPELFSTKEILGYGYENVFYDRMVIENDTVFMKKLNEQEPFLYYYKNKKSKSFYVKKDDELYILPKEKQALIVELKNNFVKCENFDKKIERAIYNKKRLTNILDHYNSCSEDKLPYFKAGIFAGAKISGIQFSHNSFQSFGINVPIIKVSDIKFDQSISYYAGAYLDVLFIDSYNWTFHPEFEYSHFKYNFKGDIEVLNSATYPYLEDEELSLSVSYLNLDLFLRYNSLRKNTSFIFDLGPIVSYNIPQAEIGSYDIDFDFKQFMLGFGSNFGIETPVFENYNITTGINANYLFSSGEGDKIKFSNWNVGLFLSFGL